VKDEWCGGKTNKVKGSGMRIWAILREIRDQAKKFFDLVEK
jgi:hypothetical protein